MQDTKPEVERYARALETLSPETIDELCALCVADVRFRDPFNEVRGRDAMAAVFRDMFEKLDEVAYAVDEIVGSGESHALKFTFTAAGTSIGRVEIPGVTWLRLSPDGQVREHLDFWDGGKLYERMPLLGRAVRIVKGRISAS